MRARAGLVSLFLLMTAAACDWMPAPTPTAPGNADTTNVAPRTAASNVNVTGTWRGTPEGHGEVIEVALEHSGDTVKGQGTIREGDGSVDLAVFGTFFPSGGRVSLSLHSEDDPHYADATFLAPVEADAMTGVLKMEGHDHALTLRRMAP
jgi:hypothetical protein